MAALPPHKPRTVAGPALLPMGKHEGKPAIKITRPVYVIGSRSSARIHLVSSSVSKAHALLVRSNGRTYIRDLASRNKVLINGREVREADLEDEDILQIGSFSFKYIAAPGEDVPRPARPAAPADLEIAGQDLPVPIEQRVVLIGRRSLCDIHLLEESVSTSHAAIFEIDGQRYIRDLGSRSGTFVSGVSTHQHALSPGDKIRIGETEMRYVPGATAGVASTPTTDDDASLLGDPLPFEADVVTPAPPPRPRTAPVAPSLAAEEPLPLDLDDAPIPTEEPEPPLVPAMAAEVEEELIPLDGPIAPVTDEEAIEPEASSTEAPLSAAQSLPIEPAFAEAAEDDLDPSIPLNTEPEVTIAEVAQVLTPPDAPDPVMDISEPVSVKPLPITQSDDLVDAPIPLDKPPAVTLGDVAGVLSPADEPATDSLELAGGEGSTGATFDPDALLAGGEAESELDLDLAPQAETAPVQDLDLEPTPEQGFKTGPIEASEPALDLVEDSDSAPATLAPDVEPILDLVKPLAASADLVPLEEPDTAELPLVESSAVAELPSLESIELEPAPIETPLSEAPIIPTEAPVSEPIAPIQMITEPGMDDIQTTPIPVKPAKKPRAKRAPRKKKATPSDPIEIIEKTDPTPESALQSTADELAIDALTGPVAPIEKIETPSVDDLTDTKFDKAVREFTGSELGDLVEPTSSTTEAPKGGTYTDSSVAENADATSFTEPLNEIQLPTVEVSPEDISPAIDDKAAGDTTATPFELEEPTVPETPAAPVEPAQRSPQQVNPPTRAPAQAPPKRPNPPGVTTSTAWGANQDNFLGGVPLNLWGPQAPPPPPRSPFGDAKPGQSPFGTPQRRVPSIPPTSPNAQALPSLSSAPEAPSDPAAHEQFVKELIEEIDDVAAAAQAAAKAPPRSESDNDDEPLMMPAIPPRPRRAGARPPRRPRRDETIPQTTSEDPTHGTITTGFDGLAMPPVRELDVFSQLAAAPQLPDSGAEGSLMPGISGTPAESGIPGGDLVGAEVPPVPLSDPGSFSPVTRRAREAAARRGMSGDVQELPDNGDEDFEQTASGVVPRPSMRNALSGTIDGSLVNERRPQVAYAAELNESEIAEVRRRYLRRIAALVCVMLLLMGGAAYTVYNYLGVNVMTEGSFRLTNLANLSKQRRDVEQSQQLKMLENDVTRQIAQGELNPEIKPEFLGSTIDYNRVVSKASFSDAHPDTLSIKVQSTDEHGDRARVVAMLNALYKANARRVEDAVRERRSLEDLQKEKIQTQQDLKRTTEEIARLRMLGETRPTGEQLASLQSQIDALEKVWNDSVKQLKDAQVELERLKSAPAQSAAPGAAQAATGADDEKIHAMQAELNQLLAKVNEARTANSQQSSSAKKNLDLALDAFQKQVTDAQAMNNNPEIAAFIKSAQELQQTTRQLTDDLIRTQEQEFGRLMELKTRLNDKMEQRRAEAWLADKELAGLKETLDVANRQYNAAIGGGIQKEAEQLKAKIDETTAKIKARQDLLPADSFYSDAIQQIQVIVDSTRKNIEENRAKAERSLTALQQSFRNNQSVQKLPEEQKQLADQLQNQLAQINEARKQYNQSLDAGADDADASLKSEINTLQAAIDLRRKQLAESNIETLKTQQEQTRLAAIESKQAEVAKLTDAEKQASEAYFAKNRELREAKTKLAEAAQNDETLDAMIRQKGNLEQSLQALIQTEEVKRVAVNEVIEPVKPRPSEDISVTREQDRRLLYTLVSCGSILVVFFVMILWNIHSLSLEAPNLSIRSTDLQPMSEADSAPGSGGENGPAPGTNGNGHPSPGNHSAADDHEPAVV